MKTHHFHSMPREATTGAKRRQEHPGTRRRSFRLPPSAFILRIGPGLALAVVALALVWPRLRDGTQSDGLRIERSRLAAIPAPPAAPELGWLLDQREALQLEPGQVVKLERLKTRWDRHAGALREALDRASAEFNREMDAPAGGRPSVETLQARAAPVSELSRRLAGARRAYWSDAARALTSDQKSRAEDAWREHLGGKRALSPRQ